MSSEIQEIPPALSPFQNNLSWHAAASTAAHTARFPGRDIAADACATTPPGSLDSSATPAPVSILRACYTHRSPHAHIGPLHCPRSFSSRAPRTHRLHLCLLRSSAGAPHGAVRTPHRLRHPNPKAVSLHLSGSLHFYNPYGRAYRRTARTRPHVRR